MFKDLLLDFGFCENDCKKLIASYSLKTFVDENLCNKFINFRDYFWNLGYSNDEIIKILRDIPAIIYLSVNTISDKFNYLLSLGYKEEEINKMWKKFPVLISLGVESINSKRESMIEMGYTNEDVLKMTRLVPSLYSYSMDNMKKKFSDLVSLNYSKEEVLKITKDFPDIYGLTIECIKEKIDFYNLIGMHEVAVKSPKYLMQSVRLSYARYQFYLSKGYSVDMCNYKDLFIGEKQFRRTYDTTKEYILEKYNYNEYLKNKKLVKE